LTDRTSYWIVPPDAVRRRLDQFLAGQIPEESRSQIQNWIRKGYILVNGKTAKTGYFTKLNDQVALQAPQWSPDEPRPEKIPLEVIFEDSDLAVINKPSGLVCHSGAGIKSGTLVNALLYQMGPLNTGDPARPGIVHRLDKLTSGVMLVAKNAMAHRLLSQQFKNRLVKKEYLAMVHGSPAPSSGTINMALGRDPMDRKKISTRAHKKRSAVTHYCLIESYGCVSFLKIQIETGRTHQIRVHLAHKGHPVVGDALYGGNRMQNLPPVLSAAAKQLQRPFLHSHRLSFQHPQTGEMLSFRSSLPLELLNFQSLARTNFNTR
jgi:23S rRNA pseudouridine1911/1915/1917 synthase